jgi:hypothetical protein
MGAVAEAPTPTAVAAASLLDGGGGPGDIACHADATTAPNTPTKASVLNIVVSLTREISPARMQYMLYML